MDDAAMCIQLRPEWEKGYFRKAAVLEAEDKNGEVWRGSGVAGGRGVVWLGCVEAYVAGGGGMMTASVNVRQGL
eukprot:365987-Chlamydomonas_euryale.AAC.5